MTEGDYALTEQQLRWVEEYLVDGNATAAARRAGSSASKAARNGQRHLDHPGVQAFLQAQQAVLARSRQPSRADMEAGLHQAFDLARLRSDAAAMLRASVALAELNGITAPDINEAIAQDKEVNPLLLKYASVETLLKRIARDQSERAVLAGPVPPAASSSPGSTAPPVATGNE